MTDRARQATPQRFELMSAIMSDDAARSLELLRTADGAVEALVYTHRNMQALTETSDRLIARASVESLAGESLEMTVIPSLTEAHRLLQLVSQVMRASHLKSSAALEPDADEGVIETWVQLISCVDALISRVDTLIKVIRERIAQSPMTALERKQARQRPDFLGRETLASVAESNAAYLVDLGKKTSRE